MSTRSLNSIEWLEEYWDGSNAEAGSLSNSSCFGDFSHCDKIVKKWAISSLQQRVKEDKHTLRDLLFFLHVPRTGGRTYFHCFLKKLYSNAQECPRSYDKLRFDPSKQECRLLVTHDDYSMMSKLPKEKTSVVTILRNPVDRIFSTYEFSVEVAARFLVHPNLTSATKMVGRMRPGATGVSTLDIWPWKYLVPWMREDLFARRDARKLMGAIDIKRNDPYNMEEMVMPLLEYINDPRAHDLVHNGETFQVAGLTNNSYFAEAHEVRHCVQKHKILGEHVLEVAKKRLDDMLYVGLTEDHRESATMFANVVGAQVISQALTANSSMENAAARKSEQGSSLSDTEPDNDDHQDSTSDHKAGETGSTEDVEEKKETVRHMMTVGKLMEAYEGCMSGLRKIQARRRKSSLKRISPANFSKEDRLRISEEVIEQIRSLNYLDFELYKYAQEIFAKQHKHAVEILSSTDGLESMFNNLGGITIWKTFSSAIQKHGENDVVSEDDKMSNSWFFDENFSGVPDNFFDDALGCFDIPLEDVEPNDDGEDWETKFRHLEPPPSNVLTSFSTDFSGEGGNGTLEATKTSAVLLDGSSQLKKWPSSTEASSSRLIPILLHSSDSKYSHLFRTTSPVSVLESSGSSCSTENAITYYPKFVTPVKRPRSKHPRPRRRTFPFIPTACVSEKFQRLAVPDPELESSNDEEMLDSAKKRQKKRNLMLLSSTVEMAPKMKQPVENRRCTHCQVTKTPQWREGPLGPKTLCNACGVRYRSGRLLPEYRPAASPTFVPFLHSNSHRKVLEMRKQTEQVTPMAAMDLLMPEVLEEDLDGFKGVVG
ncbi:unnamed protein product [Dovyalis caffra]|uniref:GATA-type domain-containing protein n=1 Tax=Dovyalis caffra TaxID=77055 RepID=A0AAV1RBG5_9ROSI|nr:unnamed protein product [Dovyalis caffra]